MGRSGLPCAGGGSTRSRLPSHHMAVPRRATVLEQQLAAIRRSLRRVVVNLRESPKEAFNMGELCEGQGDPEGAKAAYRWAIDSGHANWAPMAAVHLGVLLAGQGDHEGAKALFQWGDRLQLLLMLYKAG